MSSSLVCLFSLDSVLVFYVVHTLWSTVSRHPRDHLKENDCSFEIVSEDREVRTQFRFGLGCAALLA